MKCKVMLMAIIAAFTLSATGCSNSPVTLESLNETSSITTESNNTSNDNALNSTTESGDEDSSTTSSDPSVMDVQNASIDFNKASFELNSKELKLPMKTENNLKDYDFELDVKTEKIPAKMSANYSTKDGKLSAFFVNNSDKELSVYDCQIMGFSAFDGYTNFTINGLKIGDSIEDVNKTFGTNLKCDEKGYTYAIITDANDMSSYNSIFMALWCGKIESIGVSIIPQNV